MMVIYLVPFVDNFMSILITYFAENSGILCEKPLSGITLYDFVDMKDMQKSK